MEFDVNKAREGFPVMTRKGNPVRIYRFDLLRNLQFPILATVNDGCGELVLQYSEGGVCKQFNHDPSWDLVMVPLEHLAS